MANTPIDPNHYQHGGMDTINILATKLTPDEFIGFCKGNIIKYVLRARYKNGAEDIKKAGRYCEFLANFLSEEMPVKENKE